MYGDDIDGSTAAWNQVLQMARDGLASTSAYNDFKEMVDVVNLIDYHLVQFYFHNYDWPGNNWTVFRRRVDDDGDPWTGTGFQFVVWDIDYGMYTGDVYKDKIDSGGTGYIWMPTDLYAKARANPEFRMLFADRVHKHMFNDGILTETGGADLLQSICDEFGRSMVGEKARWGGTYSSWESTRDSLLSNWFPNRTSYMIDRYRAEGLYPNTDAPVFSQHGGEIGAGMLVLTMTNPNGSGTIYYTLDGSDPRLEGGAVSPTALVYSGAVFLASETIVKARVLDGGEWSALNEATFTKTPTALKVTEIMYNPPAPAAGPYGAQDFEYIELYNDSGSPLDVGGVTFAAGEPVTFTFPASTSVPAYGYALLVANQAAFESRYGTGLPIYGQYTGSLANGGEEVTLQTGLGAEILHFTYDDGGDWPGRADGKGSSLVAIDTAGDYDDPANWRSSTEFGGSPGAAGMAAYDDVTITEVLTHTDLPDVDAVELHNNTASDIDISGWFLSDTDTPATEADYMEYTFPASTTIPAGGYLVVTENEFNPGGSGFALSSSHGDHLWLTAGDGSNVTHFVDHVRFGGALNGVSFGRYDMGSGEVTPMRSVTLGEVNGYPAVGDVVISELMYNPTSAAGDGDLEYIELYNRSASTVDLWETYGATDYGWLLGGGVDFEFAPGTSMAPGDTLLVVGFDPVTDTDALNAFLSHYGLSPTTAMVGPYTGNLSDEGDRVQVLGRDAPPVTEPTYSPAIVIDDVDYNVGAGWPDANGNGFSLHRLEEWLFGGYAASWRASVRTPSTAAFVGAVPPSVTGHAVSSSSAVQIDVSFSGDVLVGMDPSDLVLHNETTDEYVDTSAASFDVGGSTATWTFASLDDGEYRARLSAAEVTDDTNGYPLDGDADGEGGDDYVFYFTVSSAVPGDADRDGDVDLDDLFIVRNNFGSTSATWSDGDFDDDGAVDLDDLFTVRNNFGSTGLAAGGTASASALEGEGEVFEQEVLSSSVVAADMPASTGVTPLRRDGAREVESVSALVEENAPVSSNVTPSRRDEAGDVEGVSVLVEENAPVLGEATPPRRDDGARRRGEFRRSSSLSSAGQPAVEDEIVDILWSLRGIDLRS